MYTDFVVDINTLFKESNVLCFRYLDKVSLMKYTARGRNPITLRKQFEDILVEVEGPGIKRAKILERWLAGQITGRECKVIIERFVEQKLAIKPKSTTLQLLKDVAGFAFEPTVLCDVLLVDRNLLKKIVALRENGKRIHLSGNMDANTLQKLLEKNPEVKSHVTSHVVSGQIGYVKPEAKFYEHVMNTLGINPFKTYVVDGDEMDVEFCRRTGLVCGNPSDLDVQL